MREIKFRQPLHIGREPTPSTFTGWHYWGFVDGGFIGPETNKDSLEHAARYSLQYTGLKDKNGEEIYAGDIVLHKYGIEEGGSTWVSGTRRAVEEISVVKMDTFGIFLSPSEIKFPTINIEVIGNIYENSELLETAYD